MLAFKPISFIDISPGSLVCILHGWKFHKKI